MGAAASEPSPTARWGHCSAAVGGKLYVWGGCTKDFHKDKSTLTSTLHVFDPLEESWETKSATGAPPPGIYGGASASAGHHIYHYGGFNSSHHHGSFHQLDTATSHWMELPRGPAKEKSDCGMVICGDKLVLFGGWADGVRTDEFHVFDLKSETWSSPIVSGTRPPPCGYHSLTMVDDHQAVLFGGWQSGRISDDVYFLDLTRMHWSKLDPHEGEPRPVARYRHASACLGWGDNAELLITGGCDNSPEPLSDVWVFDVHSGRWREVKLSGLQSRLHHSATSFSLGSKQLMTEVVIFGGLNSKSSLSSTTVLQFELRKQTGEWELVKVANTSQPGEVEMKKERIAYHEFLGNIEKHMQEHGSVLRRIGNLVFVGLPGSGKSTLIANLLDLAKVRDLINASPSTGIMDGIITVDIFQDTSTLKVANVDDQCGWTQVEFPISCLRQMGIKCFVPSQTFVTEAPQLKDQPSLANQEECVCDNVDPNQHQDSASLLEEASVNFQEIISQASVQEECPQDQHSIQPVEKPKVGNVLNIVDKFLKENSVSDIIHFLENKTSLYLSDTGGQIEFQELLPLLISSRAIFFFLFSLLHGLNVKVSVSFREKVGKGIKHSNSYTSSITVKESFLQTLSSIDSMETFADDSTSGQQKSYVFVVGTHRDQLEKKFGKRKAQEKLAELNRELLSLVRQHKYEDLVVMADQGKEEVMFAVDNTRHKDQVFAQIRSQVKSFIESREEFKVEFPLSYLLASLELHESKDPFIDLEKFTRDVAKYGILEADINHLINFLQSRIGLIRHFPIKELRRVLVRDPQVLYDLVSHLLIQSFLTETATVSEHSEIQKGIYSEEYLHRCIAKFNLQPDLITPKMVLLLLSELRIMAPLYDQESDASKFFVPCVLNHLEESTTKSADQEESVVQPVAVTFKCGHVPKGLFGVLVHHFLTHKKSDNYTLEWVLEKYLIFRDQVSFEVGLYRDVITLKTSSSHLEVSCRPTSQPERDGKFAIKVVCSRVLSTLLSGVKQAIVSLHYDREKTRHSLALVNTCPKKECARLHQITDHKFVDCSKQWRVLPDSGEYWFGNTPVYTFPEASQLKQTEGSEVEVPFEVTKDPPLLENKKHTLYREGVPVTDNNISVRESSIHFTSIKSKDAGKYTITSSNGLGEGHGTFHLTVSSPPQYKLKKEYVKALAGESPTLHFTVTSNPPLPVDTKHSIYNEEGKLIRRFKVSGNQVTLCDVEVSDDGVYTICCQNLEGLEGKDTFELRVIPATSARSLSSAAGTSQFTAIPPSHQSEASVPRLDDTPQPNQILCVKGQSGQEVVIRDQLAGSWEDLLLH